MTAHTSPSPSSITGPTTTRPPAASVSAAGAGRLIPAGSAVMSVVVRVAGIVPVRLDLTHVGTIDQQLGLSIGTVLVYVRSGITARAVAEAWGRAAGLARALSPAVAGRRPLVVGPSTVGVLVQLAGTPLTTAALVAAPPAHPGAVGVQMLHVQVGPVTWQVCDTNAYASLLRAWRQAARLIGDHPAEDDDEL